MSTVAKRKVALIRYLNAREAAFAPSVVCLGYFDGVHRGHLCIVEAGADVATRQRLPLCVHTYDIPPMRLIRQGQEQLELTDLSEKAQLLQAAGADIVAVSHFDEALMRMPGREFFEQVLIGKLGARHLVAGEDHCFGFHGDTDAAALSRLCREAGIGLSLMPPVRTQDGKAISSTAIRLALQRGDREGAEAMLGRKLSPRMESLLPQLKNHQS